MLLFHMRIEVGHTEMPEQVRAVPKLWFNSVPASVLSISLLLRRMEEFTMSYTATLNTIDRSGIGQPHPGEEHAVDS